jgi:hypothetical protein
MKNQITKQDIQNIYSKIEKSKKGSFFIDHSVKSKENTVSNHIDSAIANFYSKGAKEGFDKSQLKEDGALAKKLIEGLI